MNIGICTTNERTVLVFSRLRNVYSVIDMPLEWPVEVNYHEARAFCVWKGPDYRLPAEAEHTVLRGTQVT